MREIEVRATVERLLAQSRAIRAAFPDAAGMRDLPVDPPPLVGDGRPGLSAAVRYLWDEVQLVRDGKAGGVVVLDDEMANVEALFSQLCGVPAGVAVGC
jgi:hypothetical protein